MKRLRFFLARQLVKRWQYPLLTTYRTMGETPETPETNHNRNNCAYIAIGIHYGLWGSP